MKKLLNILGIIILNATASINLIACGGQEITKKHIDNFFVLGDSLSDVGTLTGGGSEFFENTSKLMPKHDIELKQPYYQNRSWCNGPVAVELISSKLKIKSKPSWDFIAKNDKHCFKFGNNYACGGAQVVLNSGFSLKGWFLNNFCLSKQINSLLRQHFKFTNKDVIYINIGSNDIIEIIDKNISDIDTAISSIIYEIDKCLINLIEKESKHIIIANIADIGLTPYYNDKSKTVSNIVEKYNNELQKNINELSEKYPNIVKEYDTFTKINELLKKFKTRGNQYKNSNATITNTSSLISLKTGILQPIYVTGANEKNIDNYFFLDKIHPTKWVQEQIANDLYELIDKLIY